MATRSRSARVALAALLVGACAAHRPAPAPGRIPDLGELRRVLLERSRRPVLFSGEMRLAGRHQGKRFRARALARFERGARIYLESPAPLAFVLACDGQRLLVLLPEPREWLELPAGETAVEELIGLPLAPEELGAVIGGAGASERLLASAVEDRGRGRLVFPGGWVDLAGRGELRGLSWSLREGDRTLVLSYPRRSLEMTLKLRPLADPLPSDLELFRPVVPAGFERVSVLPGTAPLLLPGDGT